MRISWDRLKKYLAVKATGSTVLQQIKFPRSGDASRKLRATYKSRTQTTCMSQRFHNVTLFCPPHITRRGRLEVGWSGVPGAINTSTGCSSISLFLVGIKCGSSQGYESDARLPAWCVLTLNDWRNYGCEPRVGGTSAWEWICDRHGIPPEIHSGNFFFFLKMYLLFVFVECEKCDDYRNILKVTSKLSCCSVNCRNTNENIGIKFRKVYQFLR